MFKKIAEKLETLAAEAAAGYTPPEFDDPVAQETEWTPAKGGGTNFRTHKLVRVNAGRMEFKPTKGAILFSLVFFLIGLGLVGGFGIAGLVSGDFALGAGTLIPMGIGLVFLLVGSALVHFTIKPVVFDKRNEYFWKGRKAPDAVFDKNAIKHWADLDDIHALQILSEYVRSDDSSYHSYELNLVLQNGKRINVVDHGNIDRLREDAATLAAFLDVPIWDTA